MPGASSTERKLRWGERKGKRRAKNGRKGERGTHRDGAEGGASVDCFSARQIKASERYIFFLHLFCFLFFFLVLSRLSGENNRVARRAVEGAASLSGALCAHLERRKSLGILMMGGRAGCDDALRGIAAGGVTRGDRREATGEQLFARKSPQSAKGESHGAHQIRFMKKLPSGKSRPNVQPAAHSFGRMIAICRRKKPMK